MRGKTGEPEPEVVWLKDGKRIKPKKRDPRLKIAWDISDDMYFLEIQTATKDDQGTYEVVVTNDKGEMRSSFVLNIHEAREVKITEEQIEVEETRTAQASVREEVIVSEQETIVQKVVKTTTQVKEEVTRVDEKKPKTKEQEEKFLKDKQEIVKEVAEEVKEEIVEVQVTTDETKTAKKVRERRNSTDLRTNGRNHRGNNGTKEI